MRLASPECKHSSHCYRCLISESLLVHASLLISPLVDYDRRHRIVLSRSVTKRDRIKTDPWYFRRFLPAYPYTCETRVHPILARGLQIDPNDTG